jgi:hypothetical protein
MEKGYICYKIYYETGGWLKSKRTVGAFLRDVNSLKIAWKRKGY